MGQRVDRETGEEGRKGPSWMPTEHVAGILSVAEDAILSVDMDLRIRLFNRGAERIFGYSAAEIVGEPLDTLLPDRFRSVHRDHVTEFGRSEEPARMMNDRGKVVGRRKSGEEFPAEVSISKVGVGDATIFTAILRDVSERQALEEHLRQAQKLEAIGRLAGGIAHDFNNLLTIIGGYATLLLQRFDPADPAYSDIDQIKRASDRASDLTSQLLAFSRRRALTPQIVDLNRLVLDTERMLSRAIGKHIAVVTRLEPRLGHIKVDAGQFEQVLTNLTLNARDAMPRGGTLLFETENRTVDRRSDHPLELEPGRYVALSVTDSGQGMSVETRSRIFEPFFTTKHETKGTGLGLSTVYGIVTQSGGHIWVDSAEGRGTTFCIMIPCVDEPLSVPAAPQAAALRGSATVLVVEDEDGVRRLVCEILRGAGYLVLEAAGGPDALALAERYPEPIDLLLTDVVMPYMTGPALANGLLATRPKIRVLYMSGYTYDTPVYETVIQGKTTFIAKPFSRGDLLRAVGAALGAASS